MSRTELIMAGEYVPTVELEQKFVTVYVGDQIVGLPILAVRDVLNPVLITRVPLASPEIVGLINLRGRIVTAIDIKAKLGLPPLDNLHERKSVVVEHKDELYALYIDSVGDVLSLTNSSFEPNPANLEQSWKDISEGVYRLEGKILVILDIDKLLTY